MNIGDESQMCPTCEELEWQCQCPPVPDEIENAAYDDEPEEAEGMSFEDSMMLQHPVIDYGYPDMGW